MNIYAFDDIKQAITIDRYLADRGIKVRNNHFCAVWRNSNEPNCSIYNDGRSWKDHSHGESDKGNSVLDLAVLIEGISDIFFAAKELGDRYHLTPKNKTKVAVPEGKAKKTSTYIDMLDKGYILKATYTYTDEEGKELYSVLRLENAETGKKSFLQKTPDHWGLENIRRVLYNLPAVIKSKTVYVVEGEKDADTLNRLGLCATTNNGGSKNWDSGYNRFFQGKDVIILRDNDEPGIAHAEHVLREINDVAASIKLLCPSKLEKGDVTDYIEKEKGTLEGLLKMVEETPYCDRKKTSAATAKYTIEEARALNKKPFRNFTEDEQYDEKGKKKIVEVPLQINDLIDECRRRFLDFPRRIGSSLFDRDMKTGEINYITSSDALVGWMSMKSKRSVEWSKARGAVSQAQFFQALLMSVRKYDGIASAPHYPLRPEIFYTNKPLPQLAKGERMKLDELVDRFNPADKAYRTLIKTLFMAPMFFGGASPRPAWVVDSVDGKGVGKTTLVKMVADLYGESPIDIDAADIKQGMSAIVKRLVSPEGRSRRIALMDNVQGVLRSSNLSRLITATTVSGIAPYGRGEESRMNDITYILTSNAASLDDDIAQRCYTIKLKRMEGRSVNWERDTRRFINTHRETIFAEIISLLSSPAINIEHSKTRYPEFESTVLCAACTSTGEYLDSTATIMDDTDSSNVTTERAQQVEEVFRGEIKDLLGRCPGASQDRPSFLTTSAICTIISNSKVLAQEHITRPEINEMIQSGNIKAFSKKVECIRDKGDNSTIRGLLWVDDHPVVAGENIYVNHIGVKKEVLTFFNADVHKFREV